MTDAEKLLRLFGYTPETAGQLKALNDESVAWAAGEYADTTEAWVELAVRLHKSFDSPFLAVYTASAICRLAAQVGA